MKEYIIRGTVIAGVILIIFISFYSTNQAKNRGEIMELPEPRLTGETSVEEALQNRRSRRKYKDEALDKKQISQLLWAAQGISDPENNFRTAPSAGALYPLETYAVISNVESFTPGLYKYLPENHALEKIMEGDLSQKLQANALDQEWVGAAPLSIVLTGIYERVTSRYNKRGIRYTHIEVGHAAQNIYLQAEALDLGTVAIGAFSDEGIKETLRLDEEKPLLILPVGKPQ